MDTRQTIITLLRDTQREGIENAIAFLDANGFFDYPASTRYQNREKGGLSNHSLLVYQFAMKLRNDAIVQNPEIEALLPTDSVTITALLHDTCKIFNYEQTGTSAYGQPIFSHCYRFPAGHGEKSVFALLRTGLQLTDNEILAIRWHMGKHELCENIESQENKEFHRALKLTPLCKLIQQADVQATKYNLETGKITLN